jgi:NADH:ubiquinone oxidoreductase subunit 6 (subunit J)
MTAALAILAALMLASAVLAFSRRNLIHSALLLVFTWAGIAGFYLWAGAEFVAFAQVLVYVGAVSMVVLFAVLLTRHRTEEVTMPPESLRRALGAAACGALVLAVLATAVLSTSFPAETERVTTLTVREVGLQLMGTHAAAVLVTGVLLTVALLGATIIAATEREDEPRNAGPDLGPARKTPEDAP